MKRRNLFITLLVIHINFCFSQWHQLSGPQMPTVPQNYTAGFGQILPLSNGKLLYSVNFNGPSPSSGNYVSLYISNNDFGNYSCARCSAVSSVGFSYANLYGLVSYNDSIVSYITSVGGWPRHEYTKNNFQNAGSFQYPGNSAKIGAHFNTNNYVYALVSNNSAVLPYGDTLTFVKTNISVSTNQTYIKLSKYTKNLYPQPYKDALTFLNDSIGFALIGYRNNITKSALIKSNNFGNAWNELIIDSVSQINNFTFPSENIGYLTKVNGSIYKTINGGISWNQLNSPTTNSINCINFANDTLGYIACDAGQLWKTVNGGMNWLSEVSTTTNNISALYAFNDVAYFVDITQKVYKNKPDVLSLQEAALNNSQINIYPNPSDDQVSIDLSSLIGKINSIKIISVLGETLVQATLTAPVNPNTYQLSVKELNSGSYFVVIESENLVIRKKISVVR